MQKNLKRGRPEGSTTFDPVVAHCFGKAVVEVRTAKGMSQLNLALEASIERAHMGRIERGERVPNLVAIVKIADALGCSASDLIGRFETNKAAVSQAS
ncbi:helix-turn-helix domain-containing protein [Paracidovorax wautersii]|uniref:helix-turn-helix domain-containing protein n=1 Tax=Paracidovorax wautersii TaxID=1177982 RepID=UPI000B87036A|nr:helix-turn-helix transcriptional regulator [Paracidovorax wautersii]